MKHMNTTAFGQQPIWGMAFRPFYLLASLWGIIAILLWGFGYQGTSQLPSFFWHAHEMIWGYTGAIIAGFLLTAVATWTGQPRTHGKPLIIMASLWLAARITLFIPSATFIGGILSSSFFWLAAYFMGQAVWKSRNQRNYLAVAALFSFGLSNLWFHILIKQQHYDALLQNSLFAGLSIVAGFIGLIGMRVIPFFTARRLNTPQVSAPPSIMLASLAAPLILALCYLLQWQSLAAITSLIIGISMLIQPIRWHQKAIWREPLLWVLLIGFGFTGAGLAVMGAAHWQSKWQSLGVHLIAVGGIGMLTIGMMARTALGHTGRQMYPAPKPMPAAFFIMALAAIIRACAAIALYAHPMFYPIALKLSALLFALALALFFIRYCPWLMQKRVDGKAG